MKYMVEGSWKKQSHVREDKKDKIRVIDITMLFGRIGLVKLKEPRDGSLPFSDSQLIFLTGIRYVLQHSNNP